MSARPARRNGTSRVAILGAETPSGAALREALARFGVPGARVDLYGRADGDAVLSEYGGEARLIQDPDVVEIAAHDVVYLCEGGELATRVAAARGQATVIDVVGALGNESAPRLCDPAREPRGSVPPDALLALPHPLASTLTALLGGLDRRFGIEEAVAVVLRPAADFGAAGLEELREQTVRLLNFAEVPKRTFRRQLAFNLLPGGAVDDALAARVADEVARLLGWTAGRLTIRLVTVPVFYGHGLAVRVRLAGDPTLDAVRAGLDADPSLGPIPADDEPASPLEVGAEARTALANPTADGLGGVWLWAVAGDAAATAADHAVRVADGARGL